MSNDAITQPPIQGFVRDEEATEIIAEVIRRLSHARGPLTRFARVEDWGEGFRRYLASGDEQIPRVVAEQGQELYAKLCASQVRPRLLHGDLQHYNILLDDARGWTAIDPKGVVGEVEYEIGASLRNPWGRPDLFASAETVERRLRRYEGALSLDYDRALGWGFAQAVLSAIWMVEDGSAVDGGSPPILLAGAIRSMLE